MQLKEILDLEELLDTCCRKDCSLSVVRSLEQALLDASRHESRLFRDYIPTALACKVLSVAAEVVDNEDTVVEIHPVCGSTVMVVGDTHGQFHDAKKVFDSFGPPSEDNIYIFNGDFVDRGPHGIETLLLLVCYKLAAPRHVFLIRGNHETRNCSRKFGFADELRNKFGALDARTIMFECEEVFRGLPLCARIAEATLVLHGGLFRKPGTAIGLRKLGSLNDLRKCGKGGLNGDTSTVVSDVLWSDPMGVDGMVMNAMRGRGVLFGPDATEEFLCHNGLQLIVRGHEGADGRRFRRSQNETLPALDEGYAVDHATKSGKLVTVYSCPEPYDQSQPGQCPSRGAVLLLKGPHFCEPIFRSFSSADDD